MESRRIVVPSRRRVKNMARILALLPGATVCVAKEERADYAAVVPTGQLISHDNLVGLAAIRNWLSDTVQEDCLVEVDDDLRGVFPLIGKLRRVTDPAVIAQIIENSHRVCEDLGIGVFCWSRTRNSFLADPEMLPIRTVQPVSSSFGLRGPARQRRFDPGLPGRADLDFTLRTLLEDRILFADMRWYFDHGRIFGGKGGNVGLITKEGFERGTQILYERWGRYVGRKRPGFVKGPGTTSPMSIRVQRHSQLARQE